MKLLSINTAQPRPILYNGRQVMTAIYKQPIEGAVSVGKLGVAGDTQADSSVHGGVDQAVYVYPFEHYSFWQSELDSEPFAHGQFGENFTVTGLLEETVQIGDTLKIGDASFEVSQPRVPCFKLGVRMGDSSFVKKFLHSLRVGFYLRVLQEGTVNSDDSIELVPSAKQSMTVQEVFRLRHLDHSEQDKVRQAAELPSLSATWKDGLRNLLSD